MAPRSNLARTCTHYGPFIDLKRSPATVRLNQADSMIYEAEIASPASCPSGWGDKFLELCFVIHDLGLPVSTLEAAIPFDIPWCFASFQSVALIFNHIHHKNKSEFLTTLFVFCVCWNESSFNNKKNWQKLNLLRKHSNKTISWCFLKLASYDIKDIKKII